MIEWFKNLDDANKIAIVVPVGLAAFGGLFGLIKWLYKKGETFKTQKTFQQKDSGDKETFKGGVPIGPGLGTIEEIKSGAIIYKSNTLNLKPLIDLKMSVVGGYVKRNDFGKLEAYIQTEIPFQNLQRLNEQLGLDSMHLFSERDTISLDIDNPTVFTSSTTHILPKGEMALDLSTWQEVSLPLNIHVQTQTTASGYLKGKVFQGKFEAVLTYDEVDLQVGMIGDFQINLT